MALFFVKKNGEIIFPRKIPNLNHSLLSGFKILEFTNPRNKKTIDIIKDHSLNSSPLINGYVAIIKKTTKNTIPKLILEPILTSSIYKKIIYQIVSL